MECLLSVLKFQGICVTHTLHSWFWGNAFAQCCLSVIVLVTMDAPKIPCLDADVIFSGFCVSFTSVPVSLGERITRWVTSLIYGYTLAAASQVRRKAPLIHFIGFSIIALFLRSPCMIWDGFHTSRCHSCSSTVRNAALT